MTEQLLLHYTRLVEFLGHVLGPDYEIILHEILPEQSRVAAIANGGISGRDVGAPITNAALRMIHEVSDTILRLVHPDDFVHRHYFPDDAPAKQPAAPQHTAAQPAEHFQSDMNGLMEDLFATVTRDAGVPLRRLTQAERAEIVARLYEQGMFELRGAVQFTVEKLGCSQASVYRYIKNAKAAEE